MNKRGWTALVIVVVLWLLTLGALAIVGVAFLAGLGDRWQEKAVWGGGASKIAMIHVDGEIHGGRDRDSVFAGTGAGSDDIIEQLRHAHRDDDVEAVILRIESPGGSVVASDDIAHEILRVKEDKPVVASMGDMAASGGYYIASVTDRIVANPSTLTGSIGVILSVPNLEKAADKLGIDTSVIKSGKLKDAGSPFRALTTEEKELFQKLIDQAYNGFLDAVVAGRKMDKDRVRELGDGRVYSGRQAKENGLVDDLGDLQTAYDAALGEAKIDRSDARLVEYTRRRSFGGFAPFGYRSPVEELKNDLGLGFGLKYLYLP